MKWTKAERIRVLLEMGGDLTIGEASQIFGISRAATLTDYNHVKHAGIKPRTLEDQWQSTPQSSAV